MNAGLQDCNVYNLGAQIDCNLVHPNTVASLLHGELTVAPPPMQIIGEQENVAEQLLDLLNKQKIFAEQTTFLLNKSHIC